MAYRTPFWDSASGTSTLSQATYSVIISLVTLYGIVLSGLGVHLTYGIQLSGAAAGVGFVLVILMTLVAGARVHPIVTFLGYTGMALALGAISGPFVAQYSAASALKFFSITGIITLSLGLVGIIIPRNLQFMGSILMTGLTLLIIAQFGTLFFALIGFPVGTAMHVLDWVGVILFSAFLIFDFNRAYRIPYTVENAFTAGITIYLDFINLFIRLLSLFGEKKD
jgi:FtsH-binding integral membrane protein